MPLQTIKIEMQINNGISRSYIPLFPFFSIFLCSAIRKKCKQSHDYCGKIAKILFRIANKVALQNPLENKKYAKNIEMKINK